MFSFVRAWNECCTLPPAHSPAGLQKSLVESTADSPAHDAANFTWQGAVTAVQRCSTLPSVALQHSPSPAPAMHFSMINLNTGKEEMSYFIALPSFVRHPSTGKLSAGHLSLFTILNKTDLGCLYVSGEKWRSN